MLSATGIWQTYASNRYGILFYSLLASIAAAFGFTPLGLTDGVVQGFVALNLAAAAFAVRDTRSRRIALAVLIAALAARPGTAWLDQATSSATLIAWGILALLAAASALRFSLHGRAIGREQVYAALSAYLLAGFCFGLLYWVSDQLVPGSLAVGGVADEGGIPVTTAVYFSFVTIASLGYGDVLPLSEPVRGLAVIEVVGGQLYLAVMVARLVGAWR
jgi:hypothetical protein